MSKRELYLKLIFLLKHIRENLIFEPESHTYRVRENSFPFTSVTTFLKGDKEQERVFRSIGEKKLTALAEMGTNIHEAIENSFEKDHKIDERYVEHVKDARKFIETLNVCEQVAEVKIFSNSLRLAGTIDFIGGLNNDTLIIVDWKTAANPVAKYRKQVAIYLIMLRLMWKEVFKEDINIIGYICYIDRYQKRPFIFQEVNPSDIKTAFELLKERKNDIIAGRE